MPTAEKIIREIKYSSKKLEEQKKDYSYFKELDNKNEKKVIESVVEGCKKGTSF